MASDASLPVVDGNLTEAGYHQLVAEISELFEGTRRVMAENYWKIGQKIVQVEQLGGPRAGYGIALMQRLSNDLTGKYGTGFSVKNLERMRKFYLSYSKSSAPTELGWTHYVELFSVQDAKTRERLEKLAVKEKLSARDLRKLIQQENSGQAAPQKDVPTSAQTSPEASGTPAAVLSPQLKVPHLALGTYRLVEGSEVKPPSGQVLVDLGFFVSLAISKDELKGIALTEDPAYTYPGFVDRVVDGDTLVVEVELGFGAVVRERLRLRGIDAAELGTAEGDHAKYALEDTLPAGTRIVVRTYRNDKYGRFVADVFFLPGVVVDPAQIANNGIFLNQNLLDKGLAVRMRE
jgi:endonuclease YncB( thermonuclease family)